MGPKEPNRKQGEETKQSRWGFRGMTVRDWLQLLIVPLALVVIGFLFTIRQDARQEAIEEQRAQDLALQGYLDQMSTLLLADLGDPKVRTLARARTLTVLRRLDPSRKEEVMEFLLEADLVHSVGERDPVIELSNSDLHNTYLPGANLNGANLHEANLNDAYLGGANLNDAALSAAELNGAYMADASLENADLNGAYLDDAGLSEADLSDADLSGAGMHEADLTGASLENADLRGAYMSDVGVSDADLSGADFRDAKYITRDELERYAGSLKGATMPDGQKYEDSLKDREGRKEDAENE